MRDTLKHLTSSTADEAASLNDVGRQLEILAEQALQAANEGELDEAA